MELLTLKDYLVSFVFAIVATFFCTLAAMGIVGTIGFMIYWLVR